MGKEHCGIFFLCRSQDDWLWRKDKKWDLLKIKETVEGTHQGEGREEKLPLNQSSSVQLLSRVWLFATLWITARQASLSITNYRSSPKLICIESVMPSSHLILCCPPFLLPSIPPSIRVFSNESTLRMKWSKYWSFSFSISYLHVNDSKLEMT